METNKLEWLRGPLPPVSESILTSGLLNESATISTKKIFNNNHQKKVFQSAPAPFSKSIHKIPFKPTHVLSLRPKKDPSLDFSLKPFNHSSDPNPQIAKNYKAPSIDETALTFKKSAAPLIPKENLTEKILLVKQSNYREFVQNLVYELDSNIASVVPISPEAISAEDQSNVKSQLMEFYNYSFNQLILKEKTISSDKAILLRRFMKFYNQILNDYPIIIDGLKNKNQQYINDINELQKQICDLKQKIDDSNISFQKAEESRKEVKMELEKVVKESNSKDITISTISYDNDLSKSQLNRIQFSYNQLKEENQNLSNSLKQRDEEIKGQLEHIEDITKKLAEYQQGDTGYISMYHQEKSRVEKLEKTIEDLKHKIYNLENIEKTSVAVDTTDLPVKKLKKKKITKDSPANNYQSASNCSSSLQQPAEDENSSLLVSQKKRASQTPKLKGRHVEMVETFSQTDLSRTFSLTIENAPVTFCLNSVEIEAEDNIKSISATKSKKSDTIEKVESKSNFFNVSEFVNGLKMPDGYDIDEKMAKIPSLQKFIMPLFSEAYIQTAPKDLKIICNSASGQISSQFEKPLIWGLQILHAFLTDPNVRSVENKSRHSNEDIFVDWLSDQYKVRHLVSQAIGDLARIFARFQYDGLVRLFIDLLRGEYNFSQLCFLATVYSFSITLTIPRVDQQLRDYESFEHGDIKIHVRAVHDLYSKCFSDEIAKKVILTYVSQNNFSEGNCDTFECVGKNKNCEVIDFISFLRNITKFFGEKHKMISDQARDLLYLVGCTDSNIIVYDVFECFMTMLGSSLNSIKNDWKMIVKKLSKSEMPSITLNELLELCSEKDLSLQNLLSIPDLKFSVSKMKKMSQIISEFFHDFIRKFCKKLPTIFSELSRDISEKVEGLLKKLKCAILETDIKKMIWLYKKLLSKIDYLKMKELGFIPFDYKADTDTIAKLNQYIHKAEDVAFALVSI